jgi:F0F1-type ATP synthase assembly protein I
VSPKADSPDGGRGRETAADFARYTGLGLQFAASLGLFGVLGWWLDRRLSTSPWLFILGMLVGAALAFVSLLRAVPSTQRGKKRSGIPPPGNA